MGWSAEEQALFVGVNLGPTLASNGFGDIKIMILDDQRPNLPRWPEIASFQFYFMIKKRGSSTLSLFVYMI